MDFPYTWPDTPFAHGPTLFSHMARHSFRPMDLVVRVDFGLLSFVVPTTSYYTTSTSQMDLRREISVDRNLLRDRHPLASTFPAKAPGHRVTTGRHDDHTWCKNKDGNEAPDVHLAQYRCSSERI